MYASRDAIAATVPCSSPCVLTVAANVPIAGDNDSGSSAAESEIPTTSNPAARNAAELRPLPVQ